MRRSQVTLALILAGTVLFQMFGLPLLTPLAPGAYTEPSSGGSVVGQAGGPGVAHATLCNGPDPFGYTCTVVSRPYISGTSEIEGTDGAFPLVGLHCDGCQILDVPLPFTFSFYGQDFTSFSATSDGTLQFFTSYVGTPITPLPAAFMSGAILPYWDDLCTDDTCTAAHLAPTTLGNGVFVRTTGTAPNRVYTVEWRAHAFDFFASDPNAPMPPDTFFEVQLEETTNNIYLVYGASPNSGLASLGGGATAGIQDDGATKERPIRFLQYSSNAANLTQGKAVCFSTVAGCPAAVPTATVTPTTTLTPTTTATPTQTASPTPGAATPTTTATSATLVPIGVGATVTPTTTPTSTVTVTVAPTVTQTATSVPPREEKDEKPPKKTEEQQLHESRSNAGGFDQYATQGNVVEVDYSVSPPIAYIANRDTPPNATRAQLAAVVLACPGGCPTVRPGDYIEVAGEKEHEQLYIAEGVSISRR